MLGLIIGMTSISEYGECQFYLFRCPIFFKPCINQRTDLIRLSGEFHVKLALASGNPIITKTVRELVTKTSLIVGLFGSAPHFACPDDEHLKILTAIKDKNPTEAEQLLITHLKHIWHGLNVTGYASSQNDLADILGGSL